MKRKEPAAGGGKGRAKTRQAPSLTMSDVRQVKVLANPLRIRILEELCTAERTTKQVAQRLGEKPTKLYHHVEALERVGLIRLTRTRQNRGTTEKYYMAVAQQFKADSRIFSGTVSGSGDEEDALLAMISTVFDSTSDEMRGLVSKHSGREGIEEQGLLSYLEVRTDREHARRLLVRLKKIIESLEGTGEVAKKASEKSYRLTIAFYPMHPDE